MTETVVQSAGYVEYTDCFPEEGQDLQNKCPYI